MGPTHRDGVIHGAALYAAKLFLLAAVYFAAARLGLSYASIGHSISVVWPPTGLALAALVLLGPRYWPGVALGAFFANAATPNPVPGPVGIGAGNTLDGVPRPLCVR